MYMIECFYIDRWDDAEWTEDDKPMRFSTKKEAQKEIDDFIDSTRGTQLEGNYHKEDYRVVPVK